MIRPCVETHAKDLCPDLVLFSHSHGIPHSMCLPPCRAYQERSLMQPTRLVRVRSSRTTDYVVSKPNETARRPRGKLKPTFRLVARLIPAYGMVSILGLCSVPLQATSRHRAVVQVGPCHRDCN